jgi:hypothetical protein
MSRTRFYLCQSKIFAIAFAALWLSIAAFTIMSVMSRSSTSGNRSIIDDVANGLYWGFHNIQYRGHGLSRLYDNSFLSEDLGFNIPYISRTTILDGKFLSKSAAYTRANTVLLKLVVCRNWRSTNGKRSRTEILPAPEEVSK